MVGVLLLLVECVVTRAVLTERLQDLLIVIKFCAIGISSLFALVGVKSLVGRRLILLCKVAGLSFVGVSWVVTQLGYLDPLMHLPGHGDEYLRTDG